MPKWMIDTDYAKNSIVVASLTFQRVQSLVFATNSPDESFSVYSGQDAVYVECENKPADDLLMGIKWIEYERPTP